jgi:pyruvate dehydrogenase E2 component (dihydrolipoamide acetyltransferase)
VRVPDIGDFKDVAVIELLVKPGDTVKAEQSLFTVESDKASMEIPSPAAGVLKELKVSWATRSTRATWWRSSKAPRRRRRASARGTGPRAGCGSADARRIARADPGARGSVAAPAHNPTVAPAASCRTPAPRCASSRASWACRWPRSRAAAARAASPGGRAGLHPR